MSNVFICEKCNKEFKYNSLLQKHKNRKIPCNILDDIDTNEADKLYSNIVRNINKKLKQSTQTKCGFCNKTFSTKGNLNIHLKNHCLVKKDLELNKEKIKLHKQIKKTKKNITNIKTQNNITNINITNNITNNIKIEINSYGKEDLSYLTPKEIESYMSTMYSGLLNFIKRKHLDPTQPQNHNICIKNHRNNDIFVLKDGKFYLENKDEIIEDILNDSMNNLQNKASELEDNISKKAIEKHNEFKTTYYKYDKNRLKYTADSVNKLFYSNKDIVLNTHNKKKIN